MSKQIDLAEQIRRDIEKEAQTTLDRSAQYFHEISARFMKDCNAMAAAEAYKNCVMPTALKLIDRWGARFIPEICDALQLEEQELSEAAPDPEGMGIGSVDPGIIPEF